MTTAARIDCSDLHGTREARQVDRPDQHAVEDVGDVSIHITEHSNAIAKGAVAAKLAILGIVLPATRRWVSFQVASGSTLFFSFFASADSRTKHKSKA